MLGSGDLWVSDRSGVYLSIDSPTYNKTNGSFEISYDSNVGVTGNWATEDITLPGGIVAQDVSFGDVTSTGSGTGFMGIK